MAVRLEPAQHGADVIIARSRRDGAEERVLKEPVKPLRRGVMEEVALVEGGGQPDGTGALGGELNGAGGEVESRGGEAGASEEARVMPGAAARHADGAAWQLRVRRQEIHQPRRRLTLFPLRVAGLVAVFPIG